MLRVKVFKYSRITDQPDPRGADAGRCKVVLPWLPTKRATVSAAHRAIVKIACSAKWTVVAFLRVAPHAAVVVERDACFVVEARVCFSVFVNDGDIRVVPRVLVEGENATDAFDSESRTLRARAASIARWRRSIRAERTW